MYVEPWSVYFRPRILFDWRYLSCQDTVFTGFYHVFDIFIHVWPVHITRRILVILGGQYENLSEFSFVVLW